jgi:hypothetical protein
MWELELGLNLISYLGIKIFKNKENLIDSYDAWFSV